MDLLSSVVNVLSRINAFAPGLEGSSFKASSSGETPGHGSEALLWLPSRCNPMPTSQMRAPSRAGRERATLEFFIDLLLPSLVKRSAGRHPSRLAAGNRANGTLYVTAILPLVSAYSVHSKISDRGTFG